MIFLSANNELLLKRCKDKAAAWGAKLKIGERPKQTDECRKWDVEGL